MPTGGLLPAHPVGAVLYPQHHPRDVGLLVSGAGFMTLQVLSSLDGIILCAQELLVQQVMAPSAR